MRSGGLDGRFGKVKPCPSAERTPFQLHWVGLWLGPEGGGGGKRLLSSRLVAQTERLLMHKRGTGRNAHALAHLCVCPSSSQLPGEETRGEGWCPKASSKGSFQSWGWSHQRGPSWREEEGLVVPVPNLPSPWGEKKSQMTEARQGSFFFFDTSKVIRGSVQVDVRGRNRQQSPPLPHDLMAITVS